MDSSLILTDTSVLDSVVYAALRVWLLVNFRLGKDRSLGKNRPCVEWLGNESLKTTLDRIFAPSTTELTLSQRRLSPQFTAANMHSICGLKIEWASTLDDHLYLDREHKILWVFPHRDWLLLKAEAATRFRPVQRQPLRQTTSSGKPYPNIPMNTKTSSAPLPADVYEEANRTLDLLFPHWDKRTLKLLKREGKDLHSSYSRSRMLDLKHYPYWKDRILELNEDVFLGPVEGWAQLWNDRRDPQKFWTFWIALAVFTLTIASTIASILQTWVTWRHIP